MFIDKKVWVVGNISSDELKVAKKGPWDKSNTAAITFMIVLGALGLTVPILKPEIGVLPLFVLWGGCAIALGCFAVICIRQNRKYSQLMNGRKVHHAEKDDPFDRLMLEVDDDRELLDRHNITVDILFDRTGAWEAWKRLCECPDLSEEEKAGLNERINSDVRDIARMMRDLEVASRASSTPEQ